MVSVSHLEFEKLRFLSNSHLRNGNLHLHTKFDRNRIIRDWDMEISYFQNGDVRHVEFSKIALLVMWPIVAYDSSSQFRNLHKSVNMAPRYSQKNDIQCGVRPPSWIWKKKSIFLSNSHARNGNVYLCTKFDRNRIFHGWDMGIKLSSKWRPAAILNSRKLQFWSRNLYQHAIFHLWSKFRVDRPICCRYIAKNDFQYGVRPPSWICYDVIILHRKLHFTFPTLC